MIAGRNDYRPGIAERHPEETVSAVDVHWGRVHVATNDGRSVEVPRPHLQSGWLTHGYATRSTRPRAQPSTPPWFWSTTSPTRSAHTGLSRGRVANRVYVVSDDPDAIEAHSPQLHAGDESATLREAVQRSAAQMATPRPGCGLSL